MSTGKKAKSIDAHLYNPTRTEKRYLVTSARRITPRTSLRYKFSKLNSPGGMFSLTGSQFNPHMKHWAIIFLLIATIVGGSTWAAQPGNGLFHSKVSTCTKQHPWEQCNDPSTVIWQSTAPNNDLSDFNSVGSSFASACFGVGTANCILQSSCGTTTCVALSKGTIGELSTASKALLGFDVNVRANSVLNQGQHFGYYLTTNGTVPTHNVGSTQAYNPLNDTSVVFVQDIICASSCVLGNETWTMASEGLRTLGRGDTILSEGNTACSQAETVFLCNTETACANTIPACGGNGATGTVTYLNYTGVTSGSSCTQQANGVIVVPSPGCSWSDLCQLQKACATSSAGWVSTQVLPWINIQASQYYIGFFDENAGGLEWSFQGGSFGSMAVFTFSPQNTAPAIDTGGFFGPVIKALISLGVFIAQNLFNFASYLFNILTPLFSGLVNILAPVLSALVTIITGVIKSILDAIGNAVGLGNIGTNLFTFLGDVGSFFTTFFGNALAQVSSFLTFLNNGYSTVVASFSTYWTDLANWTSGIKDFLSGLWVIGGQLFTISFAFMFSGWLLYGAKRFSDSVGEGMEWFGLTREFLMLGVAIVLFIVTFLVTHVITPSMHAIMATGEAKKTAEPDIEIGGTGVG